MNKKYSLLSILLYININAIEHQEAWNKKIYSISTSATKTAQIILEKGNIIDCQAQILVNAANRRLMPGSGIAKVIFEAAGRDQLKEACQALPECPPGNACITQSFNLASKGVDFIIHTVGPDCRSIHDTDEQDMLLSNAYNNALKLTNGLNATSIAFPFLSSGNYLFPKERAATIALDTIISYLKTASCQLTTVHFALYSYDDFELFERILPQVLADQTKRSSSIREKFYNAIAKLLPLK